MNGSDFSLPGGPMNRWKTFSSPTKTDLRRVRTFFHIFCCASAYLCPRNQQPVSALSGQWNFHFFDHPLQVPEAFTLS